MSKALPALLLFLTSLFSEPHPVQCCDQKPSDEYEKWTIIASGDTLDVEVPLHEEGRSKGLMWRNKLGADEGMLFIFMNPGQLKFWMKNTFIPLDIAFINKQNIIINIEHMLRINNDSLLYSSDKPAKMALEVNAGWFKTHGVMEGDTLTILKNQGKKQN
ncbi:hypothetical protein CR161_06770 [Prosthecochloris sp. ZM]|uniref:DUF192 domain-containing protein n=1 Tax=Prosthecochloris sp. ZM TaxID=2283143 RepID=UPI000DF7EFF0|nr:DUF192 domain-containing protein [Prosthecochloris sp. ZM]RDD30438.1 hypothetical protein CR161_06770 [Prosthecochloris sp. ZM]